MRPLLTVVAVCALAPSVRAQDIIVRDVYEAIPKVEYRGGDASHPEKLFGVLKLTDSTLSLHSCKRLRCQPVDGEVEWDYRPLLVVDLRSVREVSTSAQVRAPGVASRIAWGMFAPDRSEEFVGLVYETATSVEAPVFKVPKTTSAAIEAKVRFRLRKLGVVLPASVGAV